MWYEIHPAVGIARLGACAIDAPDAYFFGPEPVCAEDDYRNAGAVYEPLKGRVRFDADGKTPMTAFRTQVGELLRRQAVRFRVFACDDSTGALTRREIDYNELTVEWTVHLGNRKAAAYAFDAPTPEPRNSGPVDKLVVHSGPHRLTKPGQDIEARGRFQDLPDTELARLRTDDKGRLIVIGPKADSNSSDGKDPDHFANNPNWYDNTSDGPVFAKVFDKGGQELEVRNNAWVVVAPFDFAPDIDSFITLYDVARQACTEAGHVPAPPGTFFRTDVLPLLKRVRGYRWVNGPTVRAETQDRHTSWRKLESKLGDPTDTDGAKYREMLFAHLPSPDPNDKSKNKRQVYMPRLHSGNNDHPVLPLTLIQYAHLQHWAHNDFDAGERKEPETLADALDRIALEACSGGAFYPGMEVPGVVRNTATWSGAFRIKARVDTAGNPLDPSQYDRDSEKPDELLPGQLTQGLAVPWQSDFWECQMTRDNAWWPATRPDHVFAKQPAAPVDSQSEELFRWDEGIDSARAMVNHWRELGVVTRKRFDNTLPDVPPDKLESHDPRITADFDNDDRAYYYFCEDERELPPHTHHSSGE